MDDQPDVDDGAPSEGVLFGITKDSEPVGPSADPPENPPVRF